MQNYFLADLPEERLADLQARSIPLHPISVEDQRGYLVEETHWPTVLEFFGGQRPELGTTPYEGILRAALDYNRLLPATTATNRTMDIAPPPPQPLPRTPRRAPRANPATPEGVVTPAPAGWVRCTSDYWDGKQESEAEVLQLVRDLLLPVVGGDISVSVPHGQARPAPEDGSFGVYLWSIPGEPLGYGRMAEISRWDGLQLGLPDAIQKPESGYDWEIADDAGAVIAIGTEQALWILHDLVHYWTENDQEVFRRVLSRSADHLTTDPEERERRRVERTRLAEIRRVEREREEAERLLRVAEERRLAVEAAERAREEAERLENERLRDLEVRAGEHYADLVGQRCQARVNQLRTQVRSGETLVQQTRTAFIQALRSLESHKSELLALEAGDKNGRDRLLLEFERLKASPKIERVVVEGGVLKVWTPQLTVVDPRDGKRRLLGRFRIEVRLERDGAGHYIRFYNLDRQVSGMSSNMHAPHVYSGGDACLGSAQEPLAELIGLQRLADAASLGIQFLESVNTADEAGRYVNCWPEALPDGNGGWIAGEADQYGGEESDEDEEPEDEDGDDDTDDGTW